MSIIGVDDRGSAMGNFENRVGVLGGNLRDPVQKLLMLALRVIDQDECRLRRGGELARLTAMVDTELDYRSAMLRTQQ